MSDSDTIRVTVAFDEDGKPYVLTDDQRPNRPVTDWNRLAVMTEEEIQANAASDPDNPPLSDEELDAFRPAFDRRELRELRDRLGLTQVQFAGQFHIPIGTLRDWEQGRRVPEATARTLLRLIALAPELVAVAAQTQSAALRADVPEHEDDAQPATEPTATVRHGLATAPNRLGG